MARDSATGLQQMGTATLPKRESEDGLTPLAFYAWIIRTLGIPKAFRYDFDEREWIADAPFTKPAAATLAMLEAHGV